MPSPRVITGERPPSYVSKQTLAAELDLSVSTVDDYVRRGLLPKPIRLTGGFVRWSWAQVDACLNAQAATGDEDPFMAGLRDG